MSDPDQDLPPPVPTEPARLFDPGEPSHRDAPQPEDPSADDAALHAGAQVVRVVPDVSGLDREFDYLVPADLVGTVEVGTMVRVELQGRRVGAWVVAVDVEPPPGVRLQPVVKVSSVGPPAEVVELARWAAHRWAGRLRAVLRTASPPRTVRAWPRARPERLAGPAQPATTADALVAAALDRPGVATVRVGPTDDQLRFAEAAAARGDGLIIVPGVGWARWLAGRLRRAGHRAHLHPNDWSGGVTGGVVVGSRSSVWAPTGALRSVVVLDEHDEALQEERVPTWHARDVAIERARRAGVPCVLVSPAPSLAALAAADRTPTVARSEERAGWPAVEVVDQRRAEPGRGGLFSPRVVELLREDRPAVAVLNRKGRARMLACATCGALVRTEDGEHLMIEQDGMLEAPATGETRPLVCAECGGTNLKRLRLGVTRAAEELAQLVRRPVVEVTAGTAATSERGAVLLGTEAVLHAASTADTVVFLDFDQELHAPRYRAAEQAMALLVRAARLAGGRRPGSRIVVQTRSPDHRVLQAAVQADPGRLVDAELALRRATGFPPAGAVAEIGGSGAGEFVAGIPAEHRRTVTALGPRADGRFLLRADDPDRLATALAATPRAPRRVRIAVDPPRA